MNTYEQKQEARRERILARADRLRAEGQARYKSGMDRLKAIPFGQPILVGHYSEKRDRNYRRKAIGSVDKGFELMKAADDAERRAEAVGTGGISSDDPEAVQKLSAELASLQERQERMKAENEAWRKAGNKAGRQPDGTWVDKPYTFEITNNGANIRRIEARIEQLKRNAGRETKTEEFQGVCKIVQNAEANRVQLIFPGKPSAEVRAKLKRSGFRWSPMEGAWQRHLNNAGIWAAQQVVKEIAGT